jgi:hypothetical protein
MELGNTRTVFVVSVDDNKDLSDAKRFGKLRGVFTGPRKPYNTAKLIAQARTILDEWQPGDHLLMIGDPTLGAVCMSIIAENNAVVTVLKWDRLMFEYQPQRWDFDTAPHTFETADYPR